VAGSSDLYEPAGRLPINSVNFITCHDGFTLNDLVTYEKKRNEANGEGNRDGVDNNISANYGVEGETNDSAIRLVRRRQAMNFMAILMLSQGVPMLLFGDEVLRTQRGNNNSYCQNNETSWLDWGLIERNQEMLTFTQGMIAFRKRHPALRRERFLSGEPAPGQTLPDVTWHGTAINAPRWDDPESRVLAFTLAGCSGVEPPLHVILNMSAETQEFALPVLPGQGWRLAVDTSAETPIFDLNGQPEVHDNRYWARTRSVVVLESRPS
jgi:glycogen operon protein